MVTKMPDISDRINVVLDSCFIVGYCAREKNKLTVASERLEHYSNLGGEFFIPGVAIGETIWTIRKMAVENNISESEQNDAFDTFLEMSKALSTVRL